MAELDLNALRPEDIKFLDELKDDPIKFTETFFTNPRSHKPFVANYPQRLIMSSEKKSTIVCCHRRSGKCISAYSLVIDKETLKPTPICQVEGIKKTLAFDFKTNSTVWSNCKWVHSGKKKCLSIKLGTGVSLILSEDHEVFDWKRGWIQSQQLRVGDRLLAPSKLQIFGDINVNDEELGHLCTETLTEKVVPDIVYKFSEVQLAKYLSEIWKNTGRFLHNGETIFFLFEDNNLCLEFHHLLLRFEVECVIDKDNNIFIYDIIDKNNFLNTIGIKCPIYEVKSLRRWEIVTEINRAGTQDVYDLCCSHHDHNFICDDMVVHNSYSMTALALFYAMTRYDLEIVVFTPGRTQVNEFFKTIDNWINTNPFIAAFQDKNSKNHDLPTPRRSFVTGSHIEGFVMGLNSGHQEGKRGIGADIIFVDEAQALRDEDWAVLYPIIEGDQYRDVRAWIAGTIVEPTGDFYNKVKKRETTKWEEIVFVPITENKDISPKQVEEKRQRINNPGKWNTEYMLQVGESDVSVFKKVDIDNAFSTNYLYGTHLINLEHFRFIGVDWDKVGAGTNISIIQYNRSNGQMTTIWREEIEKGNFTYDNAVNRIIELWMTFGCDSCIIDQGGGEFQWERLMIESEKRGINLHDRLIKLAFQSKVKVLDIQTGEEVNRLVKPFLVSLLNNKFMQNKAVMPFEDDIFKEQLLGYKKIAETANTVKFSNTNEHIIDCHLFAMYGIWFYFENQNPPENNEIRIFGNEEISKNYVDVSNGAELERAFYDDDHQMSSPSFYGSNIFGTISRQNFGSWGNGGRNSW